MASAQCAVVVIVFYMEVVQIGSFVVGFVILIVFIKLIS